MITEGHDVNHEADEHALHATNVRQVVEKSVACAGDHSLIEVHLYS